MCIKLMLIANKCDWNQSKKNDVKQKYCDNNCEIMHAEFLHAYVLNPSFAPE